MKNLDDILRQAARATRAWERQDVDVLLSALARAVQGAVNDPE